MNLEIDQVCKRFAGGVVALDRVSFELQAATYTCIMGASGSGKTTLLRAIAGFEALDSGSIRLGGTALDPLPPERRPVHTVFQSYALFPHMSVADNVGFAAQVSTRGGRRGGAPDPTGDVPELLRAVGLDQAGIAERRPDALSGGQRQRVALARALAGAPQLLLLDEPLAALDRPLRAGLRRMLRETQRARELLFLHVTHDPEEAMALADHLILLADGEVIGAGPPDELYARPPSLAAALLLGEVAQAPGSSGGYIRPERLRLELVGASAADDADDNADDAGPRSRLPAQLLEQRCLGDRWELTAIADQRRCIVRSPQRLAADPGAALILSWSPADELRFRADPC